MKSWFICTQKKFFLKIEFENSIQDWVFLPCNRPKKVLRINPDISCLCNYILIDYVSQMFITKVTVKENSFNWIFKEISCSNVESWENFHFRSKAIYNLAIRRDKVSIWHPLILSKFFQMYVPQKSVLGHVFFLIHIINLTKYAHAYIWPKIGGIWIEEFN